jgi:acyl transferase domain-containing protein
MSGFAAASSVRVATAVIVPLEAELVEVGERLRDLGERAAALDQAAEGVALRERRVASADTELAQTMQAVEAAAVELDEREQQLGEQQARVRLASDSVWRREEELKRQASAVAARETAFAHRWRWLIRSWRRRPLCVPQMRVCDALFVPTPQGYRLLDLRGVAVAPGAVLSGLLGDDRDFVAVKIAPLPFADGWCAYLDDASTKGGRND